MLYVRISTYAHAYVHTHTYLRVHAYSKSSVSSTQTIGVLFQEERSSTYCLFYRFIAAYVRTSALCIHLHVAS